MNQPLVRLGMFSGLDLGIIIAMPTGMVYSSQVNGVACEHHDIEGAYVPFGFFPERETEPNHKPLADYFARLPYNRGCLEEETADFIDKFLEPTELPFTAVVDRVRLAESYEAWVWLHLTARKIEQYGLYTTLDLPLVAVLVWPNSD